MNHLDFDPLEFTNNFEKKAFFLRHSLSSHPLFKTDKLIELANSLPQARRLLYAANVPASLVEEKRSEDGLSVGETIERIGELKTWVGLKMITQHPEYRALVDEILDQVKPLVDLTHPGMRERDAHITISSPHSVTPYHMDSEHLFLFHIKGPKEFTVFDSNDRELVTEEDLEHHHSSINRRMALPDHMIARGIPLQLKPGDGIHVPVLSPHLVRTFDEPCISMTVTFHTPARDRRAQLHRVNGQLRARGFKPSPVGQYPWRDKAKLALFEGQRTIKTMMF